MDPDYHYGDQKSRQNPQNQVPDQFLRQMYKGRSIGPDDSQSMAAQYLPYTGARNGLSPQIYIEQGSYDSLQYNQALALAGAYSAEENVHLRAPSMALPIYAPSQSPFMNHVMDPASYYQYKNQKRTMSGEQQQYQFSGGGPSNFNGDHMANGGMYNGMACPDQPMYQLPPHEYPVKPGFATLESLGQTSEVSSKRAQRIGQLKKEIDMIDETERRYNTRGTCCCPSSKRDRTICISAIFLMLLTSGLFIFFYFPRIPDFNVLRVVTDSNAENSLSFTQDPRDKGKIDLSFTLFVDVSVINDNRYKLKIETLDLKTYIVPNMTVLGLPKGADKNLKPIGQSRRRNLEFPAQRNSTFSMPLNMTYSSESASSLSSDVTFLELLSACGLDGSKSRTMTIRYEARAEISALSRVGINPVFSNNMQVSCVSLMNAIKLTDVLEQMGLSVGKGTATSTANGPTSTTTTPSTVSQAAPASVNTARPSLLAAQRLNRGLQSSTAAPAGGPTRPIANAP